VKHIKDILNQLKKQPNMTAVLPDPPKATKTQEVLKPNDKDVWVKINKEERK
jgi:hypothetical protein